VGLILRDGRGFFVFGTWWGVEGFCLILGVRLMLRVLLGLLSRLEIPQLRRFSPSLPP